MSDSEFNIGLGIDVIADSKMDTRLKKIIDEIQSKAKKIGNIDVTLGVDGNVSKAVVAFTDKIGKAAKQIIELDKAEQKLITTQEIYSKNISKDSNAAYSKIISSMKEINSLKIKKLTADEQEAIALGKTLKLEQERLRRYKTQLTGNSELKDLEKQNEVKKLQVDLEHKYNQAKAKNSDKNNDAYLKQIQKETAALQAQANLINKMYDKNQYKHENLNTHIGNALAGDLSVQDEKSLLALKHGLSEIDLASDKAEQQIREFNAAFKQLKTDIGNGKLIESNSTDIGVKSSKAEIAEYIAALKDIEASQVKVGEIGRTTFDTFDRVVNKVTAEIHNADGSVEKLDLSFKSLGKGETEIRALDKGLKDTSVSADSLGKNVMKLVGYFISFSIVVGKIREALNVMRDVDAQLVVIQKVTDASNESMKALAKSAYSVGSEFGKSADKYLSAVAAFSRAGYKETAQELSKLSLLTQNAGDVSQETANKYLIAADAAWKLGGNAKELSKILDGMNEITNNNALELQDLSEGIQVAGSVFAQSGLEISDYSAIIGTAVANTQLSGNEMARAWRNILMNIQGIKGVTSDGDIIDEASFKKAGEAIESLGVKMTYMEGNVQRLRPVMDILNDVAIAWKKLDEAGRNLKIAELQEALGGKLQANALTAVLSNWEQVTKMQQEYFNSAGSAMKENEVYLNSWEAKTEQLKNSWVEFVAKTIDSDWIKGLLDSGTSLLHLFDNLGNALIILGGAFLALKRDSITDLFISTTNSLQRLYYQVTGNTAALEAMALAQNVSNASANTGKAAYTGMGLALNSALGVIGLVATAIGLLSMGISSYNNNQEEMRRLAVEAGQALKVELDSLEAQKQKVIQLNSELQNSNLSQEDSYKVRKELMGIQAEIIDKYGTEASSINFVTASVDELTNSYDKLSEAEARKYQQEYQSEFGDAKRYLDKERNNLLYIRSFSNDEVYEHLKNEVEKLDGKLEEMFDSSLGSTHELAIGFQIEFNKSTVEEQIVLYRNLFDAIKAQSIGASEEVSSRLDKIASDISDKINELDNETYKQHKEIFEKYIVSEVFSVDEYKNYYRDILNLQEEYYEAVSNNDEESANAKLKQMNTLKETYAESLNDTNIVNYLDNMFSSLNTQLSQNKFKLEFEADDSSLKASIEDILNDLKDLDDISILNLENVEGTEKQQAAYKRLIEIQDIYGLKIETLIELLVKLDLIQGKPLPTNPLENNIDTAEEAKKKYKELGDTLVDTIEQIKSLNSIQEKASEEGIFDISSLKTIIGLYPEAIQYADDFGKMQEFVADKIRETKDEAVLNYQLISLASQDSVNDILNTYSSLPSALATYYGADYNNFVSYSNGKYQVEVQTVKDLSALWSKYAKFSKSSVNNMIKQLESGFEGSSPESQKLLGELKVVSSLYDKMDKDASSLVTNLAGGGKKPTSNSSGGSKAKESKTIELDTLLLLEKEYSEIERQLSFIKKQKEDISLSSEQQVALAEKEITLLKHQQELRHQMAQQIRSEMKSKINVLDKYGIEVEFIPEINKLDFKQSIEEIEGIINSINLGDSDKTSDLRATLKDYINDINSSNDDLKNHSSTWYELQQLIYAANLEVASGEYYKYINNCSKSLENLDYQLELVDSNNTDEKLELINKQIQIQETVLEKNNEQLRNLQLLYKDGKINAEQFKTETDNVTKSMQESTLQLKKYNDEIKNLKLSSLEQQKNVISSIVELTKKLIQQEAKDEIDALKEITKEDNEQKKILKEINDELKKRFDKEKEIANEKKKAIDDELKAYKKKIELQKNSLDLEKEQRYYEQNLSEKQLDIRTIKDRLVELQGNDSLSANAERNRLQEELAKKQLDLDNFIFDNNIDRQKDALDSEMERYQTAAEKEKELIDKNLKAYEDSINKRIALNDKESEQLDLMAEKRNQQIEEIQKRIENNGTLTLEAMKRIDGEGDVLRDKLIEWNKVYGTGIEEDITGAWQDFNQVVITGNGILDTTRSLMQEISTLSKEIANYQSNFGSVGIRDHFESLGYDVGWNDSSKRFSIDGKEFNARGYDNIDGHLQTTLDGIRDLEKQIQNSLKGIPGLSTGGILETDRVIQAHSGERVLRKIETTDLHSILPQMLNNQQAFSVVQDQLLNQFSQKNLPIDNSFDSLPNINIENHVTLEGVATNELLKDFEEKLIESNDVITTKINNAIRKNGGNTHKKPY